MTSMRWQNAPSDDDIVEAEWKEERQIKRFQRYIALWIMEATEEETAPLIKNATLLGEWLTEALEEMK